MTTSIRVHQCVDCVRLDPEDQPPAPRPAPYGGPRSRRCATHHRAHQRAVRAGARAARRLKIYGITDEQYAALLELQGGTCAIPRCRANGTRKALAVDHDHVTGEVRGLLCGPHNYELLGKFAGDLQAGLDYLQDPPMARLRRRAS